jgi:hypothetical protein
MGGCRDIHCLSDDLAEWDSSHTDYPVEEVPERFGPLNDRQGFGNLWSLRGVFLLLGLQRFPMRFKILHDMRPLKVCAGVVSASRSEILDQVGGHQISSGSWHQTRRQGSR